MLWLILATAYLAAINVVGGVLFAADKRAAEADRRRVPERVLLTLAAAGATPAILWLTGQIRHKTRKQPFRALMLTIAGLQIIAVIALSLFWSGLL